MNDRSTRAAMVELGDRIAVAAAHLDAATARLLADLRAFDEGGGWHHDGALSCAHWLSWRVGWTLATGREHVRVARALGQLPRIAGALAEGRLSYSKVRALTRVATPATEAALLTDALETTAAQLEIICRKLRTVQRLHAAAAGGDDLRARRMVTRRELDDGMIRIEAVLRPDEAAIVWAAIESEARACAAEGFNRGDGLVAMSERTLRGDAPERAPVEVIVTIPRCALVSSEEVPQVAEIGCCADGTCVSAETSRRLACDCGLVEMHEDEDGQPLSVGRRTRTIPAAIKRAMLRRDGHCRFPGCSNRALLDGHHVRHWADGGATQLDNLCALCRRHHVLVHEGGFQVHRQHGELTFYDPRGRRIEREPERPEVSAERAWAALQAELATLHIDAATARPRWDGTQVQYGWVVDDLWGIEQRRACAAAAGQSSVGS